VEAKINSGTDFKNNDLHPIIFDSGGIAPYYTPPMATGLPDLVDCVRLSQESAVLERVYDLGGLVRLQDVLAERRGELHARFEFGRAPSGRAQARIAIRARPRLICQRCMLGFEFPVAGNSVVEFTNGPGDDAGTDTEREPYPADADKVSLRELAEEELLLALPFAAACSNPQDCGNAPEFTAFDARPEQSGEMRRPFSALQDLLKKT
jgi:uncharacterized protein